MESFDIAHVRQQGVDLIIVPLDSSFGSKSNDAQYEIIGSLEMSAHSAGLAGTVVPVWRSGGGHRFIAPPSWHSFFKSFGWNQIMANINKRLTVG